MASAFASQLQAIAANSTHELDLRARRNAHAESLLFERDVAVKQDFRSIYNICIDGHRELCQLDERFHDFDRNLFSEQAQDEDREQMTKAENDALDEVLKRCLILLGSKILLKSSQKALEWLVRRFRVHIYNVDHLLLSLLPYHEVAIWANVVSIVPSEKIVGLWKFIRPYLKTTWNVPRHAVAYAAANNDAFFTALNSYILDTCRQGLSHPTLMTFWSSIVVEAISNRLNQTRSGRKEVQTQRIDDLLHKVLPLLSDGYETTGCTDLIVTCYTITLVMVAKADLADHLLDAFLLAIAQTLVRSDHNAQAALTTMNIVMNHKQVKKVPRDALDILARLESFGVITRRVSEQYQMRTFLLALITSAMAQIKRRNAHALASFVDSLVRLVHDLYPSGSLVEVIQPIVAKVLQLDAANERDLRVREELVARLQRLNEDEALSIAIASAAAEGEHNAATLEGLLGMTIVLPAQNQTPETVEHDVPIADVDQVSENASTPFASLPSTWQPGSSCLAIAQSDTFDQLAKTFENCHRFTQLFADFSALTIWTSVLNEQMLWQTFLLRFACTAASPQARSKAIRLLMQSLQANPACDVQYFVPYTLALLTDVKPVRRAASELLESVRNISSEAHLEPTNKTSSDFYGDETARPVSRLPRSQIVSLLADVVTPVLEECLLDPSYIAKTIQAYLHDFKKPHRQALWNILTQHALATPLIKIKVTILSMLENVQKIGNKSKTKTLFPILQEWSNLTEPQTRTLSMEAGIELQVIDTAVVQLADVHDKHFLENFAETAALSESKYRRTLVASVFEHLRREWATCTEEQQMSIADMLFDMALSVHDTLASGAQNVLRSVGLSIGSLAVLVQRSQAGVSDVKAPPAKRRKRSSSSGTTTSRADAVKSIDNATAKIGLVLELVESNAPESKPDLLRNMFELLTSLRQLQQNRVDSPYLLNLCLGTIYTMVKSSRSRGRVIDGTSIKPELVTDCLRNSDNPQVQNAALLVLAALSTVVPDRMVHNVMPIFTFIGHNMLSQDDEHSINVVNEAIDKIVPALLENLRRSRNVQSYQTSVATMLASFISAYDHIPLHRRVTFYQKLLSCINAEEFGFMLVVLLANQQRKDKSLTKFIQQLVGVLPAVTQIKIYQQILIVSVDIFAPTTKVAAIVFNIQRSTPEIEKQRCAEACVSVAGEILKNQALVANIKGSTSDQIDDRNLIKQEFQSAFRTTLSSIRAMKNVNDRVAALSKGNMDDLLGLPSLPDLLESLHSVLDEMQSELRPQALHMLAIQFDKKKTKVSRAREIAMAILSKLNKYLINTADETLLRASLMCVDRITEAYGRKSPDNVIASAQHILLEVGLYHKDASEKRSISVVLTMASMLEVLKEGSVPLVSQTLAQLSPLLDGCIEGKYTSTMFRAICTLLTSVFANVAFMVSKEQLSTILGSVIQAKNTITTKDETDYPQLIRTMARKVELETTVNAILPRLEKIADPSATTQYLGMLSQAIDASSKSVVMKSAETISQIFQLVLHAESKTVPSKPVSVGKGNIQSIVLQQLKETCIKFIYKMNDTAFRPIFESWIDWSTVSDASQGGSDTTSRQIVLFDLLAHFFDTLKAIVTSYASYLLKSISTILQSVNLPTSKAASTTSLPLITNTLVLLKAITAHDQDSFFSAPSHFDPIAPVLIACLNLAASKSTRACVFSHVIPTITSLAAATMDSPSTHSALAHHIVRLKSASSAHVRLASIRALIAMTEDEDLGDEFVANVVGIGAGEGEGARGGGSSVGEIMVYVNEMLEDDDETVEHDVRRWVQMVRSKVGEDAFEV
ncbi:snoRNA-binding rRNA-processing protein utp10 [Lithohypha guttulata]|nr:snoRNA-binding rRNA-processing protein utp10 [Lithohypha guttulata]